MHAGGMSLKIGDLTIILAELKDVAHIWQDLGLVLGLTPDDLEKFPDTNSKKASLKAVLTTVLNKRNLTWEEIATALESPIVERQVLADELRTKHKSKPMQDSYNLNCLCAYNYVYIYNYI